MNQPPDPLNLLHLARASRIGLVLVVAGVVLFLILWAILGNAGIGQIPRLALSICLPPALIALAVGGYFLWIQPRSQDDD